MSYQTIQHHDASQNAKKMRLIYGSQRLSWKARIAPSPSNTLPLCKWLAGLLRVTLIGALAISGCNSKDSGEHANKQDKQSQQDKGSAVSKAVKKEFGEASWYGPGFHGQETASGETFNQKEMTAAHPSLPMGTKAKVTNLENGKKVEVRINDRGPSADGRVIDLSSAAAKKLDMKKDGSDQVKIETKPVKKKRSVKHSSKKK